MKKCDNCKWKYPESILSPMFINRNYTEPICGICALKLTNFVHGIKRATFVSGSRAENNRRAAIRWRKNHPTDAPE